MPDLDALEQEVEDLDIQASSIFRFRDAYKHIEEASKTTTNTQLPRLILIVNDFRVKIPNLISHNRIRADSKDIAVNLTLNTLDERIENINARNETILNLTNLLQSEIDKGNNDAEFLKRIKSGVDKATATVNEVKELIGRLTDTSAGNKNKISALVGTLAKISHIFDPNDA